MTGGSIDIRWSGSNNRARATPEAVRRIKNYSAANWYAYRYYFYELNRVVVDERNLQAMLRLLDI
jgi:hypothetical protein